MLRDHIGQNAHDRLRDRGLGRRRPSGADPVAGAHRVERPLHPRLEQERHVAHDEPVAASPRGRFDQRKPKPPTRERDDDGTVGRAERRPSDYAKLSRIVKEAGLLERRHFYYWARIAANVVLVAAAGLAL